MCEIQRQIQLNNVCGRKRQLRQPHVLRDFRTALHNQYDWVGRRNCRTQNKHTRRSVEQVNGWVPTVVLGQGRPTQRLLSQAPYRSNETFSKAKIQACPDPPPRRGRACCNKTLSSRWPGQLTRYLWSFRCPSRTARVTWESAQTIAQLTKQSSRSVTRTYTTLPFAWMVPSGSAVLKHLDQAGLTVNPPKCEFELARTRFIRSTRRQRWLEHPGQVQSVWHVSWHSSTWTNQTTSKSSCTSVVAFRLLSVGTLKWSAKLWLSYWPVNVYTSISTDPSSTSAPTQGRWAHVRQPELEAEGSYRTLGVASSSIQIRDQTLWWCNKHRWLDLEKSGREWTKRQWPRDHHREVRQHEPHRADWGHETRRITQVSHQQQEQ